MRTILRTAVAAVPYDVGDAGAYLYDGTSTPSRIVLDPAPVTEG